MSIVVSLSPVILTGVPLATFTSFTTIYDNEDWHYLSKHEPGRHSTNGTLSSDDHTAILVNSRTSPGFCRNKNYAMTHGDIDIPSCALDR